MGTLMNKLSFHGIGVLKKLPSHTDKPTTPRAIIVLVQN
jgi:hypothetical protein